MSIELGGLSPTISKVSLRACALASDQIAGAAAAAAPTAVPLKNVRRFILAPFAFLSFPEGLEGKLRAKAPALMCRLISDRRLSKTTP